MLTCEQSQTRKAPRAFNPGDPHALQRQLSSFSASARVFAGFETTEENRMAATGREWGWETRGQRFLQPIPSTSGIGNIVNRKSIRSF